MKQTVQIIGGHYRGKKIAFPEAEGLRPTPNRIRETLFNWLMHDIRGTRCLDAFAGSGALGFEAYSRGAAEVVFLEQSPVVYAALQKNAAQFSAAPLSLIKTDALSYLSQAHPPFDIIFLDPPFAKDCMRQCIQLIAQHRLLQPNGLIYTESSHEIAVDNTGMERIQLKHAGQVVYGLMRYNFTE